MASTRKSYLLTPSWGLKPSEVALGSAIANVKFPEKPLSSNTLPTEVDTEIYIEEAKNCSGTIKDGNKWSIGLFATFVHFVSGEISYSSKSSMKIEYTCESMETRRFTASPEFVTKAAADQAVKSHLKIGGIGAKAFVVTGIKIVNNLTITTTEKAEREASIHIGADIPTAQTPAGPKVSLNPARLRTHTKTIAGPTVFAFEVVKLHVNWKGKATTKDHVIGAVLGQKNDGAEYVVEVADEDLDDDDVDEFGVESHDGLEEDGGRCRIFVPLDD